MAVSGQAQNPGDRMALSLDDGYLNNMGKIQGLVEAVTVQDIMEKIPAPSYIIKTDIQKYDCKVKIFFSCKETALETQGLPYCLLSKLMIYLLKCLPNLPNKLF